MAYACASDEKTFDNSPNGRNSLFTSHLLKHVTEPNLKVEAMMSRISDGIYRDTNGEMLSHRQVSFRTSDIYFNRADAKGMHSNRTCAYRSCLQQISFVSFSIVVQSITPYPARWKSDGETVAGGHGEGDRADQLKYPFGLFVDEDQTVYIADCVNHRIMGWKAGATTGEILAGGKGRGDGLDQLNHPSDVIVDREIDFLIICDQWNRRVMRWPRRPSSNQQPEILIDNIACWGLIRDDHGSLYVSDGEKHEVRRYDKNGAKKGTVVVGGHGKRRNRNQLHTPNSLFVDAQSTLYVSDYENHRVMKWMKGAKEGIVVAGGNGRGADVTQLDRPQGVWVDGCENVYVADWGNNRVIRWEKGAKRGTVIVGGNGEGERANQLSGPHGLFFDRLGHLYVADSGNHRVQRFSLC